MDSPFLFRRTHSTYGVLALLLGAMALPLRAQCPGTNLVEDPVEFVWTYHPARGNNPEAYYSGVMEIGEASFVIGGETLTTRAYRQAGGSYSIPGPTMKMAPGNKYVLRFHNLLPYEAPSEEHNTFKDPNISNIHTHGLHISGESPGDDVTRVFEGGYGGDFVYDIPEDHMGGTYWYHAHHHGSTFLQVCGGAFGLLVVDDGGDELPANVAAMAERHLVIGFLDPTAAGSGGDTLLSGTLSPTWTVNGTVGGNICAPPNTWQHWRVLLADRDARAKTIEFGPECEVMLLARDGVWRTVAPKALTNNRISITGASRADFAVRVSGSSQLLVGGTVVANIHTEGTTDLTPHPFADDGVSQWSAIRPNYLRDLRDATNVNFDSISMGARTINGAKFDAATPTFTKLADSVQEWSVTGARNHPFHLHVYHVQSLSSSDDFEAGEYYDVVAANMDIRFDLNAQTSSPYYGRTIMHCHILGHEDQGAMSWMNVSDGASPPTFPADGDLSVPYSAYYSLSAPTGPAAPSDLTATADSSSQITIDWTDNATSEDGFHIERSLDGIDFSNVGSVGANVVSYTDTSLSANTTYTYHVLAYNGAGTSAASNEASATTLQDGEATSVTVGAIAVSAVNIGGGNKIGQAVVVVVDDLGNPVAGAVVGGVFSGDINEIVAPSLPTDATGTTTIPSTGTARGNVSLTFCVTDVAHANLVDFMGEVCASN